MRDSRGRSGEVYSIQHYVIKFVSEFAIGRWFSPDTPVSSTNKTDNHDITEILFKVTLYPKSQTCIWLFYILLLSTLSI